MTTQFTPFVTGANPLNPQKASSEGITPTIARSFLDTIPSASLKTPWTTSYRMWNAFAITTTANFYPQSLIRQLVNRARTQFVVRNTLNQAVTVTLVGDVVNSGGSAPDIGGATVIAASSTGTIVTDIGSAWIGVRLNCSVQPSSGTVTVDASTEQPTN